VINCITIHLIGISDFHREVDELFASLGYYAPYYAPYGGNSLPNFRDILSIPFFKGLRNPKKF
jgi:hypothetical protein